MRKASGVLTFLTALALLVFTASSPAVATGGGNNNNAPGFNGTVKIHDSTDSGNAQIPSTFAYLGIAFMAMGAVMLLRQRPRQPFTQ